MDLAEAHVSQVEVGIALQQIQTQCLSPVYVFLATAATAAQTAVLLLLQLSSPIPSKSIFRERRRDVRACRAAALMQ